MSTESHSSEIHKSHLPFLTFICLASALGGLLWGFDAIVISGTINPVKAQFTLTPFMEGFFVSSGLLGAVIGYVAGFLIGVSRSELPGASSLLFSPVVVVTALVAAPALTLVSSWIPALIAAQQDPATVLAGET